MKFKTFFAIILAIAAIVAVAAIVISKKRIRLSSQTDFDLDDYDDVYDDLDDYDDTSEYDFGEQNSDSKPIIEQVSDKALDVTADALASVDDLIAKTESGIKEIRHF